MRDVSIKYAKDLLNEHGDDLVFLDTETTGVKNHDQVIEVGAIDIHGNEVLSYFFNPTVPIDPGAQKVHGITMETLKHSPYWKWRYLEIKERLEGKKVIIFNKPFDIRLMEQTCKAFDLDPFDLTCNCAMKLASNVFKNGRGSISLSNSAIEAGIDPTEYKAHSAIGDCLMTRDLFLSITEM